MASRHYRRNLRNHTTSHAPLKIYSASNISKQTHEILSFRNAELDIFSIIDSIHKYDEFQTTFTHLTSLHNNIQTKADIINLVKQIELLVLSIFQNITDKTELSIILTRIEYLKSLVDTIVPNPFIYEETVSTYILDILDLLNTIIKSNSPVFTPAIDYIQSINIVVQKMLYNLNSVSNAENMLLSILQNIADKVELPLILLRIDTLKGILLSITDLSVGYYFAPISQVMIEIIQMILDRDDFNRIQERVSLLQGYISKQKYVVDTLRSFEELVPSILQNLADKIELPIILERLTFFQTLLKNVYNVLEYLKKVDLYPLIMAGQIPEQFYN